MCASFFGKSGPAQLQRRSGELVPTAQALAPYKYVLVYLSAHWCPPCRGFTPQLKQFYEAHAAEKNFTVVFVSLDKTPDQMQSYFRESHGDWLAVPYGEAKHLSQSWMQLYGLWGIPSLLVFENTAATDAAGDDGRRLITSAARNMVPADMGAEQFPWANADAILAAANKRLMFNVAVGAAVILFLVYFFLLS